VSSSAYQDLFEALELHQNLIHAEQQAIACKDLGTIESILDQKDKSLTLLIEAKSRISSINDPQINSRIHHVLEQQQKNTENFRKLHIQQGPSNSVPESEISPLFRRMKQAYRN